MPFPLIKLVYLFVKQVSKPLATRVTGYMKEKPFIRSYIMIPLAQGNLFSIIKTLTIYDILYYEQDLMKTMPVI